MMCRLTRHFFLPFTLPVLIIAISFWFIRYECSNTTEVDLTSRINVRRRLVSGGRVTNTNQTLASSSHAPKVYRDFVGARIIDRVGFFIVPPPVYVSVFLFYFFEEFHERFGSPMITVNDDVKVLVVWNDSTVSGNQISQEFNQGLTYVFFFKKKYSYLL